MKSPAKNMSQSLRGQSGKGRAPVEVKVSGMKGSAQPSMTATGMGGVEMAPGSVNDRSASHFTGPMSRFGGK